MINFILKRVIPIPKIMNFDRFLFIGPHPDDIELSCAPTVKKLTEEGKTVAFLIATDGRMGALDEKLFGDELVTVRQNEAKASAKLLGVEDVSFLPFHDGGLYSVEDLAVELAKKIVSFKPDVVFTADPDVISEFHADHIKTGNATKYAMNMCPYLPIMRGFGVDDCFSPKATAFYYTDRPNIYVPIKKYFHIKKEALICHASQFDDKSLCDVMGYMKLRAVCLGLKKLKGMCDGYRVYAPTHTHCFPEASKW